MTFGGPIDDGSLGAAWVYTRIGGVWAPQGDKIVGTDPNGAAEMWWSVALSFLAFGGPGDNCRLVLEPVDSAKQSIRIK